MRALSKMNHYFKNKKMQKITNILVKIIAVIIILLIICILPAIINYLI